MVVNRSVALVSKDEDGSVALAQDTIGIGLGLGELRGPTGIHIFLRSLGRCVGPDLAGRLARLDGLLLRITVALLWCCNDPRVNDPAAIGEIGGLAQILSTRAKMLPVAPPKTGLSHNSHIVFVSVTLAPGPRPSNRIKGSRSLMANSA